MEIILLALWSCYTCCKLFKIRQLYVYGYPNLASWYLQTYICRACQAPSRTLWLGETQWKKMIFRTLIMDRHHPVRPQINDHIHLQGEGLIIKEYTRCHQTGHTISTCRTIGQCKKKRMQEKDKWTIVVMQWCVT